MGGGGGCDSAPSYSFFYKQASGQIFKDDVKVSPPSLVFSVCLHTLSRPMYSLTATTHVKYSMHTIGTLLYQAVATQQL